MFKKSLPLSDVFRMVDLMKDVSIDKYSQEEYRQILNEIMYISITDYDSEEVHPSTKWVRGSLLQYEWTYHLFKFLCSEYTRRFKKVHKTDAKLRETLRTPPSSITDDNTYTQPPQCMPDQYKVPDNAVQAYRNYYIGEKAPFAKWAYTRTPEWWFVH